MSGQINKGAPVSTNYPGGTDVFDVPSLPENTPLSSAGTGHRNLTQSVQDIGLAVMALEANAAFYTHDHSGAGDTAHGNKLPQANTHQSPDTDSSTGALHHTLGTGANQAAAGNHVHDYNSSTIINKPYINCTSLTRPVSPALGTQIYEEDTHRQRVWDAFPGNTKVTGFFFQDTFQRTGNTIGTGYTEHYSLGTGNGFAGTPNGQTLSWTVQGINANQYFAQRTDPTTQNTHTPDQSITFTTGNQTIFGGFPFLIGGASDDAYFRVSADGLTYVRMAVQYASVAVYYTHTGFGGEQLLGQVQMPTQTANQAFTGQWRGNVFTILQQGLTVGTVNDYQNLTNQTNTGWGIGFYAAFGAFGQNPPSDMRSVTVQDMISFTTTTRWSLLANASKPIVQLQSGASQQVSSTGTVMTWGNVLADTFGYFNPGANSTDIVVSEAGWYSVSASIVWNQNFLPDHAMTAITINGQDTLYKTWQWVQGSFPGFAQSVSTGTIPIHCAVGDVIRVVAAHNAFQDQWTFFSTTPNQDSMFSLVYLGP